MAAAMAVAGEAEALIRELDAAERAVFARSARLRRLLRNCACALCLVVPLAVALGGPAGIASACLAVLGVFCTSAADARPAWGRAGMILLAFAAATGLTSSIQSFLRASVAAELVDANLRPASSGGGGGAIVVSPTPPPLSSPWPTPSLSPSPSPSFGSSSSSDQPSSQRRAAWIVATTSFYTFAGIVTLALFSIAVLLTVARVVVTQAQRAYARAATRAAPLLQIDAALQAQLGGQGPAAIRAQALLMLWAAHNGGAAVGRGGGFATITNPFARHPALAGGGTAVGEAGDVRRDNRHLADLLGGSDPRMMAALRAAASSGSGVMDGVDGGAGAGAGNALGGAPASRRVAPTTVLVQAGKGSGGNDVDGGSGEGSGEGARYGGLVVVQQPDGSTSIAVSFIPEAPQPPPSQ